MYDNKFQIKSKNKKIESGSNNHRNEEIETDIFN
jgi:hypothetical protein